MLVKKHRLKSTKEIENVFRQGKSTRSGFLFLKYCENGLSHSRLAFSVGIKYSKKATERNKAKRLLREEIKHHLHQLTPGFDVVIYLRQVSPNELKQKLVERNLRKALLNSNLIT